MSISIFIFILDVFLMLIYVKQTIVKIGQSPFVLVVESFNQKTGVCD